jgi:ferric-dicitrate binding protein FerR (iron transport regulator)
VVQGRVAVTAAGAGGTRLARTGDTIAVGDLLETGEDARAQALLADDTVVNLSSGTSARILQYSFDPAGGRRTAVVKLLGGKARFIVSARKNSRFNIESAQAAVAAVAAADFVVLATPDATTVAALDGGVRVKNASNLIVAACDLWPNQTTVVRVGAAPSHPAPIVPQQRKDYRKDARDF